MKPNLPKIFDKWFAEETAALVAKGATPDDLREEAFMDLVYERVFARLWAEMGADPALRQEAWTTIVDIATPEELREFAAAFRRAALHDAAYDLETLADERQLGRFGE